MNVKAIAAIMGATVKRTNANSAMVWQLIGPDGHAISGPPGRYPDDGSRLSFSVVMGNLGWKTKREATAALDELRAIARKAMNQGAA